MEKDYSFERGWSQVRNCDVRDVREKLMKALNITTRAAFCNRRKGAVEPKFSEITAVEKVFAEYGIKNVWGRAI